MERSFDQRRQQRAARLDQSRKGSVDEDIVPLVHIINGSDNYFTTSSCSGRLVVRDGVSDGQIQKQNCVWLFVSHQKCSPDDVVCAVLKASGDAVLKFEPFVLHVECRRLEDAQNLLSLSLSSGFRNSGLTISRTGRIILAVRSTHGLEVPLSHQGSLLVGEDYIHFLVKVANQKMEENLRRIQRFHQGLHSSLTSETPWPPVPAPGEEEEHEEVLEEGHGEVQGKEQMVYRRRRKRGQVNHDNTNHGNQDYSPPDLEYCLDLLP